MGVSHTLFAYAVFTNATVGPSSLSRLLRRTQMLCSVVTIDGQLQRSRRIVTRLLEDCSTSNNDLIEIQ